MFDSFENTFQTHENAWDIVSWEGKTIGADPLVLHFD